MTETYKQYNGVTMRREDAGIEMKDILLHINPDCNDLIVGPQMERALRQYFAEKPDPNKDGYYRERDHGMIYRVKGDEVLVVDMAWSGEEVCHSFVTASDVTDENGFTFLCGLNGEKED